MMMLRPVRFFGIFVFALFTIILIHNTVSVAQSAATGDLAIVGNDGNIYLYDTTASTLTAVTTDARLVRIGYQWPTWSTDGQLAFFGYERQSGSFGELAVYVLPVGGEYQAIFSSEFEAFTYAFWSPADCAESSTTQSCRDLAVLYTNGDGDLALRNVRVAQDVEIAELSVGGPHYWDWSPDGTTMFWARFGQDLELFDIESGDITGPFPQRMGRQQAVDWSPTDDRLLTAVAGPDNTSSLVILEGGDQQVLADNLQAGVAFAWSPDSTQIAYLDYVDGKLEVIQASDGASILVPSIEVLAFIWSPDGSKIAYVTFDQSSTTPGAKQSHQDIPALQWHIVDVAAAKTAHYRSFTPTQSMIYYLTFFDQFAHSHQLWSADSRYLAFGEVQADAVSVVSLIDTSASSQPISAVAEGSIGIFSWGP